MELILYARIRIAFKYCLTKVRKYNNINSISTQTPEVLVFELRKNARL